MMDPLGALVILFVVMSVVSVIGILLMYLTKEEKVKKRYFLFSDCLGDDDCLDQCKGNPAHVESR